MKCNPFLVVCACLLMDTPFCVRPADTVTFRDGRSYILAGHATFWMTRNMIADELQRALENTFVVIPMLNEEDSIVHVLDDLPNVRRVFVVDNGCTDNSPQRAREAGACVLHEPQRGYGKACLKGITAVDAELQAMDGSDRLTGQDAIVVFIDGDYSDHPDELPRLLHPIVRGDADFVIGSRSLGDREPGAMHFQAIFGNWLACRLMRLFWNAEFTDLGPFRAIRYASLKTLDMQDENFGWTIEMQVKAVQAGLRCTEVPVSYRRRIGASKISGTISGTCRAGYKILYTIFRYRLISGSVKS